MSYSGQDTSAPRVIKGVKKGINVVEGTKARAKEGVSLRKKERDERLKKLRKEPAQASTTTDENGTPQPPPAQAAIADPDNPFAYQASTPPELVPLRLAGTFADMAQSDDADATFQGVLMLRKLLSVGDAPPVDAIVGTGVVPRLIDLMDSDDWPELQFEAVWAMSNIASAEDDEGIDLTQLGLTEKFCRLLDSELEYIREQAAWGLGNMASENPDLRNHILGLGALGKLIRILDEGPSTVVVMRNVTWALSNLVRGTPSTPLPYICEALPMIIRLLQHHDPDVVVDALWAASYATEGKVPESTTAYLDAAVDAGLHHHVLRLLEGPKNQMITPAIRTVGNFSNGDLRHSRLLVECGALPNLLRTLSNSRRVLRKEAAWIISNIVVGDDSGFVVQQCINANVYPRLLQLLAASELDIQKEALFAVSNSLTSATELQREYLLDLGILSGLLMCLTLSYNSQTVLVALETLDVLLDHGRGSEGNTVAQRMESLDGWSLIDQVIAETQDTDCRQGAEDLLFQYDPRSETAAVEPQQHAEGSCEPRGPYGFAPAADELA